MPGCALSGLCTPNPHIRSLAYTPGPRYPLPRGREAISYLLSREVTMKYSHAESSRHPATPARRRLCAALVFGTACIAAVAPAAPLVNETFDHDPGKSWRFACQKTSNATGRWENASGQDGTGGLFLRNPSQRWANWALNKVFPARPGERYRVSCSIKSQPGSGGVRCHVTAVNNFRGPPNTDADWQRNEWTYTVPKDKDTLAISLIGHGVGSSVWFDNLRVERLDTPGLWHRAELPTPRNFAPGTTPALQLSLENPAQKPRSIDVGITVKDLKGTSVIERTLSIRLEAGGARTRRIAFPELGQSTGWFALELAFSEAGDVLETSWEDFTIFDETAGLITDFDPTSVVAADLMPHNSFRNSFSDANDPAHVERVTHELRRLRALGVNYLRLWTRLRKDDDGQFVPRPDLDLMCPIAARLGMRMTMVLGADDAVGGTCGADFARQDLEDYVRWVAWAVERYSGTVRTFEIANEVKANPQYVDALRPAYVAAKRVDPGVRILHAAAYWYHWQNPKATDVYTYSGKFWPHLLAFGWPYSEGLNIHEYGVPQGYLHDFLRRYQGVCDTYTSGTYGESIWQTECGSDSGVSRPHGVPFPPGLTPGDQAAAAAHQYLITKAASGPDMDHKAFWYLPTDGWGRPIGGWWATGFYDVNRSAKASALAVKATAEHLRDATFVGELSTSGRDHIMVFRKDKRVLVAAWASIKTFRTTPKVELGAVGVLGAETRGRVRVSLPAGPSVELFDLSLTGRTVPCPTGELTLLLDQFPVFIYGIKPDVLLAAGRQSVSTMAEDVSRLFSERVPAAHVQRLADCRELALGELNGDTSPNAGRLTQAREQAAAIGNDLIPLMKAGDITPKQALPCLNVWRIADLIRELQIALDHAPSPGARNLAPDTIASRLERQQARLSVDRHAPKTATLLRLAERRLHQARRAGTRNLQTEKLHRLHQAVEALERAERLFEAEPHIALSVWLKPAKYLWTGNELAVEYTLKNASDAPVRGVLQLKNPPAGWDMSLPPAFNIAAGADTTLTVHAHSVTGSRRTSDLIVRAELDDKRVTTGIAVGLRADGGKNARQGPPDRPIEWRIPWWTGQDGNPFTDNTGATWTACQVSGPPEDPDSYKPMNWNAKAKRWLGPGVKHGNPSFGGNTPALTCSRLDDGHRDPALIVTAPRDGLYSLTGSITITEYPRGTKMAKPLTVQIGTWPPGRGFQELFSARVTARGELALPRENLTNIPLVKGQKLLVCRFSIGNLYRYASYTLGNVRLVFAPGAGRVDVPAAAQPVALPPAEAYVTVRDGHLSYGGNRLRIWSAQGNLLAKDYTHIDAEVERFASLGFNGYRAVIGSKIDIDNYTYAKGDLSAADRQDYLFTSLAKHGVRVWSDALNSAGVTPGHVDIIDDPDTRAEWLKALGNKTHKRPIWVVWDERAEAGYIQQIKGILGHVNQHNGLRWADDPVFFCWEITNEQWWLQRIMKYRKHLSLPPFFQRELLVKWNAWVMRKYGSDERLREAWLGSLIPGETLKGSSVMLLPLSSPVGLDQAEVLGLDITRPEGAKYGPRDFSQRRGADVMEFLVGLLLAHKQKVQAAMRSVGQPGIGISTVPIVFDTGFSFSPQSMYVSSHGDAVCSGCYMSQITLDRQHPRFPFRSSLEEPPRLFYDNPWIEQNKIVGKPTFIYETQIFKPAKYRAEYAYMLAMLGSIQDWDVIDWHYYGHPTDDILTNEKPFDGMLRPDNRFSWQGIQFKHDEVQLSTMRLAGTLFRTFAFAPPERPSVLTLGRDALFDINMAEWGHLNPLLCGTVYRYGLRLAFDMTTPTPVHIDGPVVHGRQYISPVIRPTPEIQLNWHDGVLKMDSASAKVACGFLPDRVRFDGDVELSDISLQIPGDMPYLTSEEDLYACVGLVAADGQPLAESRRMLLSAVCSSFNTGFTVALENFPKGNHYGKLVDYVPTNKIADDFGKAPVLVARVGLTCRSPLLVGCTYTLRDWHMKTIRNGRVGDDGVIAIGRDEPVFIVEIERDR